MAGCTSLAPPPTTPYPHLLKRDWSRALTSQSFTGCSTGTRKPDLVRPVVVALALAAAACGPVAEPPKAAAPAPGEWREFEGSWNATGSRRTIPLGADRRGSIIDLRGTMLLAGPGRPGVGFRSEVIALVDSETGLHRPRRLDGRARRSGVQRIERRGHGGEEPHHGNDPGRHGPVCRRHRDPTSSRWQFVIEAEDGSIQGRAVGPQGPRPAGQPDAEGAKP